MKPIGTCRLYGFVDTAYLDGRDPPLVARQLCDGGVDLLQMRAKGVNTSQVRHIGLALRAITASANVGLVINDHPQIALEVGADLCHLGQEDFFDPGHSHVRELPGFREGLQYGLSTHSPVQAQRALAAEPSYIAIGPVFATPTKATAKPVTLDYVRWAKTHVSIPWFAIGGISLENLDSVLEAGATRICVVSAILRSSDVARTCQDFKNRLACLP